jgi:Tfp pilus assembly protein PilE
MNESGITVIELIIALIIAAAVSYMSWCPLL